MADIIQVKRGKSKSWICLNPTLRPGEPGFETDTGRIKIGDGIKTWNELGYIGEGKAVIINAPTHYDFPAIGDVNILYKASQEKQLYQWNAEVHDYELLIDLAQYVTQKELQAILDKIPEVALENYATIEYAQGLYASIIPLTKDEILDACE
jgi:hypothetical protein